MEIHGDLDRQGVETMRSMLTPLLEQNHYSKLFLDFHEVNYIGSSALAFLMEIARSCTLQGRKLIIANVSPEVKELFQILNLGKILSVS